MNMIRNIIIAIVVLILAVAIPVTVRLAQQQQQLKTRAQEACDVADPNACPDLPMYCEGSGTFQCTGGYCDENISQCVRSCAAVIGDPLSCAAPPPPTESPLPSPSPPDAQPADCSTFAAPRPQYCSGKLTLYDDCTAKCVNGKRYYDCRASQDPQRCVGNNIGCQDEDSQCAAAPSPSPQPVVSPSPSPAQGGNVGVGGVDVGDCSSITIDGQDFRQHPGLVVNQTYNVQITMANTKVQTPQNSWKSGYSLRYTGGSASQLGLSTTNISVPNPPVETGESRLFPVFIVKPSTAGTYQFYWQMYNDQNQPFSQGQSGKCTPGFTVFTTLPGASPSPSPGTACTGTIQLPGDIDSVTGQRTRFWRCESPGTSGCVDSSADSQKTCSTQGKICVPCISAVPTNKPNTGVKVGECGKCQQWTCPTIENPQGFCPVEWDCTSVDSDDSVCRRKTPRAEHADDRCINAGCVRPSDDGECKVCWGTGDSRVCELRPQRCPTDRPFCKDKGFNRGSECVVQAPSPAPSPSPIPSPPAVRTACFFLDDNSITKDSCANEGARAYETHPMIVPFTLTGSGKKFIFVRFISTTGEKVDRNRAINFLPNPSISDAQCTHLVSGVGTQVTLTATNIGPRARAKVKLAGVDAEIISWNEDKGEVVASIDRKIEGTNALELTRSDGKVARAECVLGTTTVAFAAQTQCKKAGDLSADNVSVKIFANVPTTAEAEKPEPLLDEKIKLNKDGKPTGFSPKLEKSKKYSLILKAPGSLSKRVDFETKSGTKNLEAVTLLTGDIAPASRPDGKINAVDRGEMIRQWNLVSDVARTADFNGDGRVNSIDYACMRGNINQSDEEFSPPVPKSPPAVSPAPSPSPSPGVSPSPKPVGSPSPSPSPGVSPSPSPPVGGPSGILPFRVSFDANFATPVMGDMGVDTTKIVDLTLPAGPGLKSVYVQFFENGVWGPTPPQTATINLLGVTSI